jgi:acyl-CoA thioester hydrolase
MKVKIYYHHTDCGGVVYYANYLKFFEEARTEFFQEKGISVKALIEEKTLFVVSRQEIEYKYPAFYGDTLTVNTLIDRTTPVRMEFSYEVRNQDNKVNCIAHTTLVCVDKHLKPQAMPEALRKKLTE